MITKDVKVVVEERIDGWLVYLPHNLVIGYGDTKIKAVDNFHKWYDLCLKTYGADTLFEELDNVISVQVESISIPIEDICTELIR